MLAVAHQDLDLLVAVALLNVNDLQEANNLPLL